jgi:signal transduction histidine kinase
VSKQGIRYRLLTLVLLGILTSGLSLVALVRILSVTTAQRLERVHEAVQKEAERIAAEAPPARSQLAAPPASAYIGMSGGFAGDDLSRLGPLAAPVAQVLAEAGGSAGARVRVRPVEGGQLVIAVKHSPRGLAFAAYLLQPPAYLRLWQGIVTALALATALLVISAGLMLYSYKRGAAALHRSLSALATDLEAEVARPNVSELADIAEGIARLAGDLAKARARQDKMARELADQERLASLGRVAAGVAHEVRNPLAAIKLHLDLTAVQGKLAPAAEKAIRHATAEIDRLDRLVADLLMVAGRSLGRRAKVDLGALVQRRIEALGPWAEERGIELEGRGDASCTCDADSLGRAVDNLLRNAVEAAPRGSRVTVAVEGDGGRARVLVCDQGTGVSAERAAELFEPFFTTKPDGTGLGLAISRAIARAHGGDLTYARERETTRFEIELPAERAA